MTTAEIVSVASLCVFSMSLTLSAWTFAYQFRSSRVTQTERMHEVWWSDEMMTTRDQVFALRKTLLVDDSAVQALVAYYLAPLTTPEPPGRAAFSKLIGFFCNLEICLSTHVVDERLSCRLFAESHYADYLPLIVRLREAIAQNCAKGRSLPHWLQMTIDLEKRFARYGADLNRQPS